ncbi:class I SAM-dependent methyltransferase [Catenovulum sediminis]|uniref:Methyltransferase n=1 Tax=Catenovulum sediminis TaxID=1740262 RepID=A0ABV1RI45_9ALTE
MKIASGFKLMLGQLTLATCLLSCSTIAQDTQPQSLRSESHQQRDTYRHPTQTLSFFEVEPTHSVVEIWPGGGWYTEILAPMLHNKGQYYAAHFPTDIDNQYFKKSLKKFQQKLQSSELYNQVILTEFNPNTHMQIAPENSVDRVLTFRNLHNWYMYNGESGAIAAFKSFYKALKPGGILGVVDHRLPEHLDQAAEKHTGYIKSSLAISWALQAGFELVAASEINANPDDTAQHPNGVWTLPPTLRIDAGQKDKYLNIGESDRFTLKFRKPNQ